MAVQKARNSFQQTFDQLDGEEKEEFLQWIFESRGQADFECLSERMQTAEAKLADIINDLKDALPFNGVLDSEKIYFPTKGEHADCDPNHTISIDAFLHDDWSVDQLCEEGKLQRSYCKDCGSHNTTPITFISHSMSKRRLQYLFLSLIPDLKGKTVLDIGSRLGTVLYGAYMYSQASRIIGIEMNEELCQLQQRMVTRHGLNGRIEIVCGDVCNHAELLKAADVIVIHSVIDFFLPEEDHSKFWKFISDNTRQKNKMIVSTPSLERAVKHLPVSIDITSWVDPATISEAAKYEAIHDPEVRDINLYVCL